MLSKISITYNDYIYSKFYFSISKNNNIVPHYTFELFNPFSLELINFEIVNDTLIGIFKLNGKYKDDIYIYDNIPDIELASIGNLDSLINIEKNDVGKIIVSIFYKNDNKFFLKKNIGTYTLYDTIYIYMNI